MILINYNRWMFDKINNIPTYHKLIEGTVTITREIQNFQKCIFYTKILGTKLSILYRPITPKMLNHYSNYCVYLFY